MGAWGTYSWLVDVGRGTASVNVLDRLLQPCRHGWHCKKCPNQPNCLLQPVVWSVIHTKHKSDPCNIKYSSVLECDLTGHKAEKRQIQKMQETKKTKKTRKTEKSIYSHQNFCGSYSTSKACQCLKCVAYNALHSSSRIRHAALLFLIPSGASRRSLQDLLH